MMGAKRIAAVAGLALAVGLTGGVSLGEWLWRPPVPALPDHPVTPAASALDIGYAQAMLVHHRQALILASFVQETRSPPIRRYARSVLRSQQTESDQLTGWLIGQGAPLLPTHGGLMHWLEQARAQLTIPEILYLQRCSSEPTGMVGLLPSAAIRQLADTSQPAAAREERFLELMILHHEGALEMSAPAARLASHPFVANLARSILEEQRREIQWMRAQLDKTGAITPAQSAAADA